MDYLSTGRLRNLADEYTAAVNAAISEDREDLVRALVAEYPDRAAALIAELEQTGVAA